MKSSPTVIVALTGPPPSHLGEGLARFADEAGSGGEVLLMDASGGCEVAEAARRLANVRVISRDPDRLAPSLWRDGLLVTDAGLIALSTAQMIPGRGWLAALTARMSETGAAGVGGPIEPAPGLGATDRAVALLRYADYFPASSSPLSQGVRGGRLDRVIQPPGDNALYRRDALMNVQSSWIDGFWEVEVHDALRRRGESLAMAERAVVTFEGGVGLAAMAAQRFRHARRYAVGRSRSSGTTARVARIAAAPLVPPLLCLRALRALQSRRIAPTPWLPALPALAGLATAWAIGEAVGTWSHG